MAGSSSMKLVWLGVGSACLAGPMFSCNFGVPGGDYMVADAEAPDAGVTTRVVHGTSLGMLAPLDLHLVHEGGDETLRVAGDGSFAFMARLAVGTEYSVVPLGDAPCVVANGAGVIDAIDVEVELVCESVLLSGLTISGPAALDLGFDPVRREYSVDVSLLQQGVRVTATADSPDASIEIASNLATSGVATAPLPLALGDNAIDIKVSNMSGAERTYSLTLRRAAQVAQRAYGKASNTGSGDLFGYSVALWGDTLAVGAPREDSASTGVNGDQGDDEDFVRSGAVYVFRRTDGIWSQEAYIKALSTAMYSELGISVALWGDTLAVGAWGDSSPPPGSDDPAIHSGAVYVFRRVGNTWEQEALLKGPNTESGDELGISVALWGDTLAVGAPQEDSSSREINGDQTDNEAINSGAVYVFRRTGSSWVQEAYIKASNAGTGDELGISVALWNDVLVAGALFEDSAATGVDGDQDDEQAENGGAAYVFRRTGSTWVQEAYLKASNTDAHDNFGYRVALWGETLAVGAAEEDSAATGVNQDQFNQNSNNSGAVYVFGYADGAWAQEAYIKAHVSVLNGRFGDSLALRGDILVAGAFHEDVGRGAAYVFQRVNAEWSQQSYLKASNVGESDRFGFQVALSEDSLVVGAPLEDSNSTGVNGDGGNDEAGESGAVYVFH